MRVAFFGSGSPLSVIVLRELSAVHEVATVVTGPEKLRRRDRLRRLLRILPEDPLTQLAKQKNIQVIPFGSSLPDLQRAVAAVDLLMVASFPRLIPPAIWRASRMGGINLHQSLLPRGRGPDPLFWTYYDNEPDAGSSVHWLDEGFDSGDLISQQRVPVARGRSSVELYFELAEIGARQLVESVSAIEKGTAARERQDVASATYHPSPLTSEWRVAFDQWPAERTWHFLSGTGEMFGRLCRDPSGTPMPVGRATSFVVERHNRAPGSHQTDGDRVLLFCPDGVVTVNAPTPRSSGLR